MYRYKCNKCENIATFSTPLSHPEHCCCSSCGSGRHDYLMKQEEICDLCEYKLNYDGGWCYMFQEMFNDCQKFILNYDDSQKKRRNN